MNTLVVVALGALLLLLPFFLAWLSLPTTKECPFCGGETIAVVGPVSGFLQRLVERRWCLRCDWEGFTRSRRPRRRRWRIEAVRDSDEERSGTSGGK